MTKIRERAGMLEALGVEAREMRARAARHPLRTLGALAFLGVFVTGGVLSAGLLRGGLGPAARFVGGRLGRTLLSAMAVRALRGWAGTRRPRRLR